MEINMFQDKLKIMGFCMIFIILTSILPASAFTEEEVNDYTKEVSSFIDEKCHGDCEDIIILGDDYVIPHYRKDFYMENGWNFLGWKFGREYEHPVMLTDDLYIQKHNSFDIADLQYVFSDLDGGQFRTKPVVLVIPDDMDENFTTAVTQLKHTIGQKFSSEIEVIRSIDVHCDDLNHFNSFEDAALVIVGTEKTNHAFNCYPVIEPTDDSMYIDINVWDPDNNALIIKTDDSNTLSFYSMFIYFEQYKSVHAPRMTVIDKVVLSSGAVMIVVGVGLTVSGFGSAIGVPLAAAGFALDAASITNECWIENGGGRNWNGCYLDVGVTIGSFGIGKWVVGPLLKKLGTHLAVKRVMQNLDELGKHIPQQVLDDVFKNTDDVGELAIRLSNGVDLLKRGNIPLDDFMKITSNGLDDAARLRMLEQIGDIASKNSDLANDFAKNLKNFGGPSTYSEQGLKKLQDYIDIWRGNPFRNADSKFDLVRVFNSPNTNIKTELGESIGSAVLTKGDRVTWGYQHIFEYVRPNDQLTRSEQIIKGIKGIDNNDDIMRAISDTFIEGEKRIRNGNIEIFKLFPGKEGETFELVVGMSSNSPGSIQTVIPNRII